MRKYTDNILWENARFTLSFRNILLLVFSS